VSRRYVAPGATPRERKVVIRVAEKYKPRGKDTAGRVSRLRRLWRLQRMLQREWAL